jgi:hypothetical protein
MSAVRVPPKLDPLRTTAGFPIGPREAGIGAGGLVLALALMTSGLPFALRIVLALGLVGLAAGLAIFRVDGRLTQEAYLLQRLGYLRRIRWRLRGYEAPQPPASPTPERGRLRSVPKPRAWPLAEGVRLPASIPGLAAANAAALMGLAAFLIWLSGGGYDGLALLRQLVLR